LDLQDYDLEKRWFFSEKLCYCFCCTADWGWV